MIALANLLVAKENPLQQGLKPGCEMPEIIARGVAKENPLH